MHVRSQALAPLCAAALALTPIAVVTAQQPAQPAQPAAQPDFRWEKALPANSFVGAHNINGDVIVTPSTSGKVEVVGVKRGNRRYFDEVTLEVVETRYGITICAMFKYIDSDCDEDGLRTHNNRGWRNRDFEDVSIDIEVKLPKGMELDARSISGNVKVAGAEGRVRASSVSGDVRAENLRASSVRASSVSGDVTVVVDALTGEEDRRGDLRFSSVSGNVIAELPKDLNADVSMSTVSGSLNSDFALTLNGRMNRRRLEARIGKGGRSLEVSTVSGDVRLRAK